MCGWLSLTQKSSIGSCRLHWIRSQEISFDKPIVFAPKSPDTPKGNRESFFGCKHFENTLCIGRISMNLIWYVHQNHFHRRGSTLQSLQLFQASWCTTIWSPSSKAVTKADTVVWKGWETDPLWVKRQVDNLWKSTLLAKKRILPESLSSPRRNEWLKRPGMTRRKASKVGGLMSLLYHCCKLLQAVAVSFALCGSWFFEVYLGVFQSTLRLFWSTDPKERPGTFS